MEFVIIIMFIAHVAGLMSVNAQPILDNLTSLLHERVIGRNDTKVYRTKETTDVDGGIDERVIIVLRYDLLHEHAQLFIVKMFHDGSTHSLRYCGVGPSRFILPKRVGKMHCRRECAVNTGC